MAMANGRRGGVGDEVDGEVNQVLEETGLRR